VYQTKVATYPNYFYVQETRDFECFVVFNEVNQRIVFVKQMSSHVADDNSADRKRPQVRKACEPCRRAHACCDDNRPCRRCVTNKIEEKCFDAERKKRGRKKKSEIEAIEKADSSDDAVVPAATSRRSARTRNSKRVIEETDDLEDEDYEDTIKKQKTKPTHKKAKIEQNDDDDWDPEENEQSIIEEQNIPPLDDDETFENGLLVGDHEHDISDFDSFSMMDAYTKDEPTPPNTAEGVITQIQSAAASVNSNQIEFVQKLLQELQQMKQRMESHTEEIKGLRTQNQQLLEQLAMETYKHNAQNTVGFNGLAFSYAFENAGVAMIITATGGRILSYNKAFSKLFSMNNRSNMKYAYELLTDQNDVKIHTKQWSECYNTNLKQIVGSFSSDQAKQQELLEEPISYVSTARTVAEFRGDIPYHCSIICDNNKKPLYSFTCIFIQSKDISQQANIAQNYRMNLHSLFNQPQQYAQQQQQPYYNPIVGNQIRFAPVQAQQLPPQDFYRPM
jgi:PAS domain-containing protein